jgi:hypothetical protein
MLTISKRTWLASALAALTALAAGIGVATSLGTTSTPFGPQGTVELAQGNGGQCPPGDPDCTIEDHDPGEDPPDGPGGPGGGGGGPCTFNNGGGTVTVSGQSGESLELVLAAQTGEVVIPCNHPVYGFYSDGCFWGDPPPLVELPEAPPDGENAEDGAWYYGTCITEVIGELPNQDYIIFAAIRFQWFDNGAVPVITPEQVAQDWLASVTLLGVEFQLAPPTTGSGLVTLPVWLGVAENENSWGPIFDDHCLGGVCVSITAQVANVDWTMGDGTSFNCTRDQHVAWESGMDYLAPGGNCHHYYQRASRNQPEGKYQITATSNWTVHWEADASDAAGDLETTREATVALEINEIQVLTQ